MPNCPDTDLLQSLMVELWEMLSFDCVLFERLSVLPETELP